MRILIADQDTTGSIGWYCARALKQLGHDVAIYDLERRPGAAQQVRQKLRSLAAAAIPRLVRRVIASRNRSLLERIRTFKPDLLLVSKGRLLLSETLLAIRGLPDRPCTVNWFPDAFLDFNNPEILRCFLNYDHLFFKEKNLISHLVKVGAANVHYLPHCSDAQIHKRVELDEATRRKYQCEVAYAGHMYHYKTALLRWLAGFDLKLYGVGWEKLAPGDPLKAAWFGGPVYGEDLTHAFNACKSVLNLHQHLECMGLHLRTFDAAACGSFQLVDDRPEVAEFFTPGKDLMIYKTPGELIDILKEYLPNDTAREQMGRNAMAKVQAKHTYHHRLSELIDVIGHSS